MRSTYSLILISTALYILSGCNAIQVAKLDPAASLETTASTQKLDIKGLKLFNDQYTIGSWSGRFNQSASGVTFLKAFERHKTKSEFTVTGPGLPDTIFATCNAKEVLNTIGRYELGGQDGDLKCLFEIADTNGNKTPVGGLVLSSPSSGRLLDIQVKRKLTGTVKLGATQLAIQSEHKAGNALIATERPLGYSLSLEGRNIALVDVNTRTAFLPAQTEGEKFQATLLGVLALVFFQDPQDGDSLI